MKQVFYRAMHLLLVSCAVHSYSQTATSKAGAGIPDCAPLAGQILSCPKLGFAYKVPFGWVDRTREMQQSGVPVVRSSSLLGKTGDTQQPEQPASKTLMAIFERPPGTGDTLDPAVVIAVEDRSAYPQVKTAADYIGAIAEVARQRGLKMNGDPYSFVRGSDKLVRADFSRGAVRQSSLVYLHKNYILSFTFLAATDDDVDLLVENLSFVTNTSKPLPKKK